MEKIKHVAIIVDGNRRWARRQGFDIQKGHRAGIDRIQEICDCLRKKHIPYVSFYAWSTENWDRTKYEQNYLFELFYEYLVSKKEEFKEKNIRLKHFGRTDRLPRKLIDKFYEVIKYTRAGKSLQMNLCLDYGGRDEIVRAV